MPAWKLKKIFLPVTTPEWKSRPYKLEVCVKAYRNLCVHAVMPSELLEKKKYVPYNKNAKMFDITHISTGYRLFPFMSFLSEKDSIGVAEFLEQSLGDILQFKHPRQCTRPRQHSIVVSFAEAIVEKKLAKAPVSVIEKLKKIYQHLE